MSTAYRCQKSPRSLSGTFAHPSMGTQMSTSWSGMNDSHPYHTMWIDPAIHEIKLLHTLAWNFKVNVMDVVKGWGHVVSPVAKWFTSFSLNINQTNDSSDTAISKLDLEKSNVNVMGGRHGWASNVKVTYLTNYPTDALPFRFMFIRPTVPEIWPTECLTLTEHIRNFEQKLTKKQFPDRGDLMIAQKWLIAYSAPRYYMS